MDQRRIELQIRLILVTYRREHRRQDSPTMVAFRHRALQLLVELDSDTREYPELHQLALAARRELSSGFIWAESDRSAPPKLGQTERSNTIVVSGSAGRS